MALGFFSFEGEGQMAVWAPFLKVRSTLLSRAGAARFSACMSLPLLLEEELLWESIPDVKESVYPAGRTGNSDEKCITSGAKEGVFDAADNSYRSGRI